MSSPRRPYEPRGTGQPNPMAFLLKQQEWNREGPKTPERPNTIFGRQGTNTNWLDTTPRPERPAMNGPLGRFGLWQGQNTNWLAPDLTPQKPDEGQPITQPQPIGPRQVAPGSYGVANPMAGVVGEDNNMVLSYMARLMPLLGRR